jgi:hypothetical protein
MVNVTLVNEIKYTSVHFKVWLVVSFFGLCECREQKKQRSGDLLLAHFCFFAARTLARIEPSTFGFRFSGCNQLHHVRFTEHSFFFEYRLVRFFLIFRKTLRYGTCVTLMIVNGFVLQLSYLAYIGKHFHNPQRHVVCHTIRIYVVVTP